MFWMSDLFAGRVLSSSIPPETRLWPIPHAAFKSTLVGSKAA
jgi:hypothetical protein